GEERPDRSYRPMSLPAGHPRTESSESRSPESTLRTARTAAEHDNSAACVESLRAHSVRSSRFACACQDPPASRIRLFSAAQPAYRAEPDPASPLSAYAPQLPERVPLCPSRSPPIWIPLRNPMHIATRLHAPPSGRPESSPLPH